MNWLFKPKKSKKKISRSNEEDLIDFGNLSVAGKLWPFQLLYEVKLHIRSFSVHANPKPADNHWLLHLVSCPVLFRLRFAATSQWASPVEVSKRHSWPFSAMWCQVQHSQIHHSVWVDLPVRVMTLSLFRDQSLNFFFEKICWCAEFHQETIKAKLLGVADSKKSVLRLNLQSITKKLLNSCQKTFEVDFNLIVILKLVYSL